MPYRLWRTVWLHDRAGPLYADGVDPAVVDRARSVAAARLAELPSRLAHVGGVAAVAVDVAAALAVDESDMVVAAAWLHDVGYARSIRRTGFHPVDGAEFVRAAGFAQSVVSLVAYHSGSVIEAEERGLTAELAAFPAPPAGLLDVVTYADMTTGPNGEGMDVQQRLAEILVRYPPDDVVHRAITRSAPELMAAVGRVQRRLATAGSAQPR